MILMLLTIIVGYLSGYFMEKYRQRKSEKIFFLSGLVFCIGALIYFKYAGFIFENINQLTGASLNVLDVALPVGISFYTFQIISYLADVYKGNVPAQKNIISLGTYVTMFPQLIAGPIVRYGNIVKQLKDRVFSLSDISYGIRRFILGLGKKILIANQLGELCDIIQISQDKSIVFYWIYALAASLHIYFDFSGYSDMAIGLGKILGFHFPENFNYPYMAGSITEFWRRWHMTLGSWFRDYVYIPLGGNRVKKSRWFFNIFVIWMLTGLWHGAAWNFALWGIYFAVLLVIEKQWLLPYLNRAKWWNHLYVILMVMFSFIIFNSSNIQDAGAVIGGMFGMGGLPVLSKSCMYYLNSYGRILLLSVIGATPLFKCIVKRVQQYSIGQKVISAGESAVLVMILLLCTAYLADGSFNPFLYFRF